MISAERKAGAVRIIESRNNAFIIEIAKLKQKKHRDAQGLFYVEGAKLLKEALASDYNIRYVICAGPPQGFLEGAGGFELIRVTREVYAKLSDEEGFEGVMCVLEKPAERELRYDGPVIVMDGVQNPGNVGAVIRAADALCRAELILTGGCADIYSGRVQRAAMGAVFRQNIKISGNIKIELEILRQKGYNIFAAWLGEGARPLGGVDFGAKPAVLFGSEGAGLGAEVAELCDERVIIPVRPGSESLNVAVAAGIILWEIGGGL